MPPRTRDHVGKVYASNRGRVTVYSSTGRFSDQIIDLIDEQTHVDQVKALPQTADYAASHTALSAARERHAARFGAPPVVLPEGGDWLRNKITDATLSGVDVTIVIYNANDQDIP